MLYKSLVKLILGASSIEAGFALGYLQRVLASEYIRDDAFQNITAYSPKLTQALAQPVIELTGKYLIKNLPDEKVAHAVQRNTSSDRQRDEILAKPEEERTQTEKMVLPLLGSVISPNNQFTTHDWDELSIV